MYKGITYSRSLQGCLEVLLLHNFYIYHICAIVPNQVDVFKCVSSEDNVRLLTIYGDRFFLMLLTRFNT